MKEVDPGEYKECGTELRGEITIHGVTGPLDSTEKRIRALRLTLMALSKLLYDMAELDDFTGLTYDVQCRGRRPIRYRIDIGVGPPLMQMFVTQNCKGEKDG